MRVHKAANEEAAHEATKPAKEAAEKPMPKVHPAAECFRLMNADELAGLAADISTNGLHDPIVLGVIGGSEEPLVVDGRNRLKACEMAGVEPRFATSVFANDDAVRGFVRSRNERRDLSKGEKAMGLALLYPKGTEKGGRGHKGSGSQRVAETAGVSGRRLRQAREVLAYSYELACAVRDGTKQLDAALKESKAARKAQEAGNGQLGLGNRQHDRAGKTVEQRLAAKLPTLLDKRYGVILAHLDPLFSRLSEGENNFIDRTTATAVIGRWGVPSIVMNDSVLILGTMPKNLPHALQIMFDWQFTYDDSYSWPQYRDQGDLRSLYKPQLFLVGTRGNPRQPVFDSFAASDLTAWDSHGTPKLLFSRIDALYPSLPKIEIEPCEHRRGWESTS